jgi:hypothetical protein
MALCALGDSRGSQPLNNCRYERSHSQIHLCSKAGKRAIEDITPRTNVLALLFMTSIRERIARCRQRFDPTR